MNAFNKGVLNPFFLFSYKNRDDWSKPLLKKYSLLKKYCHPDDFGVWTIFQYFTTSMDFQLHPNTEILPGRTTGFSEGIYSIRFVQFELSAVDTPQNERTCGKAAREMRGAQGKSILRPPRGTALRTPMSTKVQLLPYPRTKSCYWNSYNLFFYLSLCFSP